MSPPRKKVTRPLEIEPVRDPSQALLRAVRAAEGGEGPPLDLPWRLSHGMESGMSGANWLDDHGVPFTWRDGGAPALTIHVRPVSPLRRMFLRLEALLPEADWAVNSFRNQIYARNAPLGRLAAFFLDERAEVTMVVLTTRDAPGDSLVLSGEDLNTPQKLDEAFHAVVKRWRWWESLSPEGEVADAP